MCEVEIGQYDVLTDVVVIDDERTAKLMFRFFFLVFSQMCCKHAVLEDEKSIHTEVYCAVISDDSGNGVCVCVCVCVCV